MTFRWFSQQQQKQTSLQLRVLSLWNSSPKLPHATPM